VATILTLIPVFDLDNFGIAVINRHFLTQICFFRTDVNVTLEKHSSWNIAQRVDVGSACVDRGQSPLTYLLSNIVEFSVNCAEKAYRIIMTVKSYR